ncbi:hypothetical protein BRAS3809_7200002 [Bradyrhizobium sp. STM 3809]|nr:hypothetical protein BRAS3809_7200002 [Bradyrhizobium sp. STM 3809]
MLPRIPPHAEGVRVVTIRGVREAMDETAACASRADERGLSDVKSRGPGAPKLAPSSCC